MSSERYNGEACRVCLMTLDEWCAEGMRIELCRLCHLMGRSMLERYNQRWSPGRVLKRSEDAS